ncbi:MAG: Methyltransferase type 11 [Bacteroidetes bacterium]|jgi:SAM-dependent methyltransferase|nr:Methyltransferase type 11 [Bacteroidota bacterium]
MTLEESIKEQYSKRADMDNLYSGTYSRLADSERRKKIKLLLEKFLPGVENKTVLEIGAGQGDNVKMLQECGFKRDNIYLNELLEDRINILKINQPGIKVYAGNALDVNFDKKFDCVFQSTVFTSILDNKSRKQLATKMWDLLEPGGIILWYDFIYNNPKNPDVKKVTEREVMDLFPLANESQVKKVTLAPPIGRRVGNLYSTFNLPFLRSHILAVLKKD